MTVRREMLEAAAGAGEALGDSAELVSRFVLARRQTDRGYCGRSDRSDLYYTAFALQSLAALRATDEIEATAGYLRAFGGGEGLDFVHLACLARCWALLPAPGPPRDVRQEMLDRLAGSRCADDGFSHVDGADHGTAYGCFLALGAWQDLGADMPRSEAMGRCLESLRSDDGGYANAPGLPVGAAPASAATAVVLRELRLPVPAELPAWLLACRHTSGGFLATPAAPIPDLLSTATTVHALAALGRPLGAVAEACCDYVESLWDGCGGFRGNWADTVCDCEYVFYALLALGHVGRPAAGSSP